jgi:preprotein translocase subunit SecA
VILLANARPSTRDLDILAQIISKARELDRAPEEVASEIKEKVPELSSLSSYFPKTRMEFIAYLTMLVALLGVFAQFAAPFLSNQQGLNKEQVEEVVNRAVKKATGGEAASKKAASKKAVPRNRKKTGRNELCPCGSGKKYKKCCLDAPGAGGR